MGPALFESNVLIAGLVPVFDLIPSTAHYTFGVVTFVGVELLTSQTLTAIVSTELVLRCTILTSITPLYDALHREEMLL